MTFIRQEPRKIGLGLVALALIAAAVMVALAPEEQTLGQGIKVVYVHVALTWTGMLGIAAAGLLGLLVMLRPALLVWLRALGWTAWTVYALGFVISAVAEQVNWGAVFWDEPRMHAAMNLIALGLIVQVLNGWLPNIRLRGLVNAALAAYMVLSLTDIGSVLHPDSAMRSSASVDIQFAFVGLFALFTVASAAAVWMGARWMAARRDPRA